MTMPTQLKTFLWFKQGQLDEALDFYAETFNDMQIHSVNRPDPNGSIFTSEFSIFGHQFVGMAVDGGPEFNDAISLSLSCDGQAEVDALWSALTKDGAAGQCGWCKDKFGLSWQVTPIQMGQHLGNPDPEKRAFAMNALRGMTKIVLNELHS